MKRQIPLGEMIFHNTQMTIKHSMEQKCTNLILIIMKIKKVRKYHLIITIHLSIQIAVYNPKFLKKFPLKYLFFLIIKRRLRIGS